MADVTLTRFAYLPRVTLGRLEWSGLSHPIYTVECPWRDNAAGESCIPEGVYRCRPRQYHKGGYPAIEVTGVPDRSLILFHIANVASDIRGCIGPGLGLATVNGQWGVAPSQPAFKALMAAWGGREFDLEVRSGHPFGPTSA